MLVNSFFLSKNEAVEDQTFARTSLLQRLDDDDDSVVDQVLRGGKVLLQIIGEDAIIEQFEKKLHYRKPYSRFECGFLQLAFDNMITYSV